MTIELIYPRMTFRAGFYFSTVSIVTHVCLYLLNQNKVSIWEYYLQHSLLLNVSIIILNISLNSLINL
jgi:hypothetical protein